MAIVDDVANYVREQGRESSSVIHTSQVASALGLSMNQVETAKSKVIRVFDDIYPCSPGAMVYEPDWKSKYPEEWAAVQERSRKMLAGSGRNPAKVPRAKFTPDKHANLPNVVGPVIMIHNVQGVNVHPDHIAIQHIDGSWTHLDGSVTIAENEHG